MNRLQFLGLRQGGGCCGISTAQHIGCHIGRNTVRLRQIALDDSFTNAAQQRLLKLGCVPPASGSGILEEEESVEIIQEAASVSLFAAGQRLGCVIVCYGS
ncbi:hypothetical protein [Aestuariivirga sp.]|uniref:hypothetical protein n=1 Tax=Aestuariivirga sp. TaxID=2650926 RepID=UPI0037849BDF